MDIHRKRGYFVHASTSKEVMINHISQFYYKKGWRKSGRPILQTKLNAHYGFLVQQQGPAPV